MCMYLFHFTTTRKKLETLPGDFCKYFMKSAKIVRLLVRKIKVY